MVWNFVNSLTHPNSVCVCVLSLAIFLHHCTFAKSTGFRREFYFHFIFCIIFYSLAVSSIEHCVCPSMFPSSRSSWLVSSSKLWYETVIEANHINRAHQSTVHSQSTHKVNPFIELKCNEFILFFRFFCSTFSNKNGNFLFRSVHMFWFLKLTLKPWFFTIKPSSILLQTVRHDIKRRTNKKHN